MFPEAAEVAIPEVAVVVDVLAAVPLVPEVMGTEVVVDDEVAAVVVPAADVLGALPEGPPVRPLLALGRILGSVA